jgi:hypothetical protein
VSRTSDRTSTVLGWLLFAVPVGLFLLLAAWIMSIKLGLTGGLLYVIALVVWAGLLVWRAARS